MTNARHRLDRYTSAVPTADRDQRREPPAAELASPDRVLFETESVTIGAFRCPIDHPSFRDAGRIKDDCFVFPRTVVEIRHCDAQPFIADPTVVTLYNRAQLYERRPIGGHADRCDWYAVSPEILRAALLHRD